MKKLLLSIGVIGTFILYSWHQQSEGASVHVASPGQSSTSSSNPAPQAAVAYKDGTFTGDTADAYYGNLQVRTTIAGGKITDVQFLQYPNDQHQSIEINTQAMPYLKQEAIQAQNSQVDTVSGATQSSRAFRESLQSALSKSI